MILAGRVNASWLVLPGPLSGEARSLFWMKLPVSERHGIFTTISTEHKLFITASVDFETDQRVQQAIRNLHGVTILTVAHRLRTIMDYDKVLVLNEGHVLEYDSPKALLANPKGFLRSLVDSSSERQELETLAGYTA